MSDDFLSEYIANVSPWLGNNYISCVTALAWWRDLSRTAWMSRNRDSSPGILIISVDMEGESEIKLHDQMHVNQKFNNV